MFQWLIVAGGLNAQEEVLSSVEILQHSNGALQVKKEQIYYCMICSAMEADDTTSVHPLDGKGKQSQWVLPPLWRAG